jgi:hypothetical protein
VLSSEYRDHGVPFLRILDIKPGFVETNNCVCLSAETHARENRTAVRPRDFIVAKTGASIGYSAVIPDWLRDANICQDLVGIRLKGKVDPYYLQGFISSSFGRVQADRWRQGNAHPHLGNDGIREWIVPVPTDDIQQAIGNKVRKAERLRELADDRNYRIRKAVFDAVGLPPSPIESLSSWVSPDSIKSRFDPSYFAATVVETISSLHRSCQTVPLSSLVDSICTGSTPAELTDNCGIRFFPSGAVSSDFLSDDAGLFISATDHDQRRSSQITPGDILCAKDGNTIGHLAVVPRWATAGNINEHTYRIRLNCPDIAVWTHAFLVTEWGRRQILREAVGSAQAGLGRSFIDNVSVVLPKDDSVLEHIQSEGMQALDEMQEAKELMQSVHKDIEQVVANGDFTQMLESTKLVETWLIDNPTPRNGKRDG